MSKAAAVLVNNYEHLAGFLSDNPHISNKLACLVRELTNLPHLRVVYCAFAALRVHLIEPFYARTITQGATNSELKVFYKKIYECLINQKAHSEFLIFSKPFFPGVLEMLLKGVKNSYGMSVLQSTLGAVSRSIILQKIQQLREAHKDTSFHSYKVQVEAKRELDVQQNKIQIQKFKEDAAMKREVALNQERKEEVQEYLDNSEVDPKVKQARMKKEVKFARDSSTTLSRVDPLFKIQVTMKNKKHIETETAIEFGEALMVYLGRRQTVLF
ncbi:hypothetical protein EMCRGX_G011821 [Ephydatia muelleri]